MPVKLSELEEGERAVVAGLETEGALRRRLRDMGVVENNSIVCIGKSPLGDPTAYEICSAVIAIRNEDAEKILVEKVDCNAE